MVFFWGGEARDWPSPDAAATTAAVAIATYAFRSGSFQSTCPGTIQACRGSFSGELGPCGRKTKKKKKKEKESTNTPKPKYTTYPSIHYSIHIQIHPPSGILEGEENVLWKFPVEVHDPAYSCCVFCCAELEIPPVARVRSVLVFFFFFFFFAYGGLCAIEVPSPIKSGVEHNSGGKWW